MPLLLILIVLFGHWLADFVLQKKAKSGRPSKSLWKNIQKNFKDLFPHTVIYGIILSIFIGTLQFANVLGANGSYWDIIIFFLITFITHVIIDNIIININSEFLKKNQRYNFFVSIGFDQLIHYATVFGTIQVLYY